MQQLNGKTAFITGGASGIGYAMAQAFLREGMRVVITDVDEDALASARDALQGSNTEVLALPLDVTDRNAYAAVVQKAWDACGGIQVLCNNAGVYRGGALDKVTYEDWDWILGVNLGGVANGLQNLLPRMRELDEPCHVVNTASMAGIVGSPGLGVYNASKFAVVGLSESLRQDLADTQIKVSVLCPGMVRTRILESERTRPVDFDVTDTEAVAAAQAQSDAMHMAMGTGIDAAEVADLVVQGIKDEQFYLFPHAEMRAAADARAEEISGAFGEADPERVRAQEALMAGLLGVSPES